VDQVRAETVALRDTPTRAPTPRVAPKASEGPRRDVPIPVPLGWGVQVVEAQLPDVWQHLDKNTLFRHHWGGHRAKGAEYTRIVGDVFEPELAQLQADALAEGWLEARIVSGVFACNADGDSLVLWSRDARELARLSFPRQAAGDQ